MEILCYCWFYRLQTRLRYKKEALVHEKVFIVSIVPWLTYKYPRLIMEFAANFTDSSNITIFGVKDKTERYLWIGWTIFIAFTSISGNSIILIGSTRYKALRLNNIIVTLIQQIALNDLLITMSWLFPHSASLITNSWVFGRISCILSASIFSYALVVSILLVMTLTTSRLLILKFPIRASILYRQGAHKKLIGFIWIYALIFSILHLILDIKGEEIIFDYRGYMCDFTFQPSSDVKSWLFITSMLVNASFPMILILITTALLLYQLFKVVRLASRTGAVIPWHGLLTVILTAGMCLIAFVPMQTAIFYTSYIVSPKANNMPFTLKLYRASYSCIYVHTTTKFFIYCIKVESFRAFLRSRVVTMLARISLSYRSWTLVSFPPPQPPDIQLGSFDVIFL